MEIFLMYLLIGFSIASGMKSIQKNMSFKETFVMTITWLPFLAFFAGMWLADSKNE